MTTATNTGGLPYDPEKPQRILRCDARNVDRIALSLMYADVVIATVKDGEEILLHGYGDQRILDDIEFDPYGGLLTVIAGLPYAANVQINNFSNGSVTSVNIVASGEPSVAAMSIGSVNLGGPNPTIDGIPLAEYKKQQEELAATTITVEGRSLDPKRKIFLVLVVPERITLRIARLYGMVAIEGNLDGKLNVRAVEHFELKAKAVRSAELLLDKASATIDDILENTALKLGRDGKLDIGKADITKVIKDIAPGGQATINGVTYTA